MRWFVRVPWFLVPFVGLLMLTVYAIYIVSYLAVTLVVLLLSWLLPRLGVAAAEGLSIGALHLSRQENPDVVQRRWREYDERSRLHTEAIDRETALRHPSLGKGERPWRRGGESGLDKQAWAKRDGSGGR